ncbi:hypothetical protein EDD18DRAFT_1111509 [Armillaria luteobubalina]|uniref:Uncharacterized protein n=1 Tax=Armillaria luteobubalina TaxID=153913 RepID=A0AA39PKF7_9AGAR|nr:hypothetical protein EDD18DRAFT_1111509 [Armillaria luteobubalina]
MSNLSQFLVTLNTFKWLRYYSYNFQDLWCHSLFYTSANITNSQGSTGKLVDLNPPMHPGSLKGNISYFNEATVYTMQVISCTVTLINQTAIVDAQSHLLQCVYPVGWKMSSTWSQWNPETIPANTTQQSTNTTEPNPGSTGGPQLQNPDLELPCLPPVPQGPDLEPVPPQSDPKPPPSRQKQDPAPAPPLSGDMSPSSQPGGNTSQQGSNNMPTSNTGTLNSGNKTVKQAVLLNTPVPRHHQVLLKLLVVDSLEVSHTMWWELFSQVAVSHFPSTDDCPRFPWSNSEACNPLTIIEQFLMEDLGLHFILLDSPIHSAHKITLHDLENTLATLYAKAGGLKDDDPYNIENINNYQVESMIGNATISYPFAVTCLNINLIPLILGLLASVGLLLLIFWLVGKPIKGDSGIDTIGILQIVWLMCTHPNLQRIVSDIDKPTVENLQESGMVYALMHGHGSAETHPLTSG